MSFTALTTALRQALIVGLCLSALACSSSDDSASVDSAPVESDASGNTPAIANAPVSQSLADTLTATLGKAPGGISALVVQNGQQKIAAVGQADASGTPLATDDVLRVGSLSKPVIAIMTLQLMEEGLIDLDRPLSDYRPETLVGGATTIRALLSHQSGIPDYTAQESFGIGLLRDLSHEFTPDDILRTVENVPAQASGTFRYSNTNYVLLGQLIEKLDGGDLQASLKRRITSPLQLDSTRFVIRDSERPTRLVPAWTRSGLDGFNGFEGFAGTFETPYTAISTSAWAAGALVSSLTDLKTLLDALLTGSLLKPETLTMMLPGDSDEYGLGISRSDLDGRRTAIGHSGLIPGYSAVMMATRDNKHSVFVLSNNDSIDVVAVAVKLLNQMLK